MSQHNFGSVLGPVVTSTMPPGPQIVREEQALGLKAIYAACRTLYPDQPTPLQVTALRKFWMGGPDPLDFINMYSNPGSPELDSPAHWHYVTNGLSDLYGDSRLHSQCTSTDDPSGFGFELTLRVRRDPAEINPPTWPAHLLQSLARYVFHSQAQLMVGDHIPWPSALDKPPMQSNSSNRPESAEPDAQSIAVAAAATAASLLATKTSGINSSGNILSNPSTYASMVAAALAAVNSTKTGREVLCSGSGKNNKGDSGSRIRHMLLVEDPQLKRISTPYGYVQFLQLVGLCDEELRLVQRWTGSRVAELMRRLPGAGGGLLVTDMRRKFSLFELEPHLFDYVNEQLRREGSNLSGVTTQYFAWAPISLTALNELLPGEADSLQLHQSFNHSNKPVHPSNHEYQSGDQIHSSVQRGDDPSLPTDLSMPRATQSVLRLHPSPEPTAMETDEIVVSSSASARQPTDEDEFVDVVGDSDPPSVLVSKNTATSTNGADKLPVSAPTISTDLPTSTGTILGSGPANLNHTTSKVVDPQSTSAPGAFSPWCGRIETSDGRNPTHLEFMPSGLNRTRNGSDSFSTNRPHGGSSATELSNPTYGPMGFRPFHSESPGFRPGFTSLFRPPHELGASHTPGSAGDGSAPCTPLAHLSLSPASLDLYPTRVIKWLDVHLCREAGEMLPLAVNDRLKHGRHFTFLNANFPDHAITLVPNRMSGALVSEENPYVARGPWLQILFPDDFLDQLESQFSCLMYPDELQLPLVFRWPERHLRICVVDPTARSHLISSFHTSIGQWDSNPLLPKAMAMSIPEQQTSRDALTTQAQPLSFFPNKSFPRTPSIHPSGTADHMGSPPNFPAISPPNLPLFPPGFIPPPPPLLAAMLSGQHSDQQTFSPASPDSLRPPNQSLDASLSNWTKILGSFMNQRELSGHPNAYTSYMSNPFAYEAFQSALSVMQKHGSPNKDGTTGVRYSIPSTNPSH